MENVTTIQDKEPLIFTDSAAEKVKKLIEEEKNPALNLSIYHWRWMLWISIWVHI